MAYRDFVNHAAAQLHLANQLSDRDLVTKKVESIIAPLNESARSGRLSQAELRAYLNDIQRLVETTAPPVGTTKVVLDPAQPKAALAIFIERMEAVIRSAAR